MSGRFTWLDLMTTDPEAAVAFYAKGFDWGTQAWDGPMPYTMFARGEQTFGGVMQLPEEAAKMGAPPHWLGYVAVDDVEASTAKARSLGATVQLPPTPIPGVGRFSVIADPQGAILALFQSDRGPEGSQANPALGWTELMTSDLDGALAFYGALFGWQKADAMDMGGDMGVYQMFGDGKESFGGMMKMPPMVPMANWAYYLNTDDAHARVEKLTGLGAQLRNGPMEVPGGGWAANLQDPQGAWFALFSPPKR